MCIDDGCDGLLCCLCAPLAAIFCCKLCKDKMGSNNNISQAPDNPSYPPPDQRVPGAGVYGPQGYGPPVHNQGIFYPGGPQPYYPPPQHQAFQGNYYPQNQGHAGDDLPRGYVKQQPRLY